MHVRVIVVKIWIVVVVATVVFFELLYSEAERATDLVEVLSVARLSTASVGTVSALALLRHIIALLSCGARGRTAHLVAHRD